MHSALTKLQVLLLFLVLFVALGLLGYRYLLLRANVPAYEDGVLACYVEDNPELVPPGFEDTLEQTSAALESRMLQSDSVDAQVVATAAFAPRQARLQRLRAVAAEHPDNALAALHVLSACLADISLPGCDPGVVSAVETLDSDNAFAWTLIAGYRSLQNDDYGTLASLRQANAAPVYDTYLGEQIALAVPSMPQGDDVLANTLRVQLMFHALFDVNLATHHATPASYCLSPGSVAADLAGQCLALGERMAEESDVLIQQMLGLEIQQLIHASQGNTELAEAQEIAKQNLRDDNTRAANRAFTLQMFDAELNRSWLDNVIDHGEGPARNRLVEQAREKSADPAYRPCQPPGIRFDFPFFYSGPDRIIL